MKKILAIAMATFAITNIAFASAEMENFKPVKIYENNFTDVESGGWYAEYVKSAYETGLVGGTSETTFSPESNITIAETITLATRVNSIYAGKEIENIQGEKWYDPYIKYALKEGLILENQFNNYTKPATRGEFVEVMAKTLPKEELNNINNIITGIIPDVSTDSKYAASVYMLYNAGIISGSDEYGTFNPESTIKRSEVSVIISRLVNKQQRVKFSLRCKSHNYLTEITDATCAKEGKKVSTCIYCGNIKEELIDKKEHRYDNGKLQKNATCTSRGSKLYTCLDCGYKNTEYFDALGHKDNGEFICSICNAKLPVDLKMSDEEERQALSVYYIADRSVQYDKNKKEHTLLFSFKDIDGERIKAPAVVEIRIVNDNDEEVYSKTKIVRSYDFGIWTSAYYGERLLASVDIKDEEIKEGTSDEGKIYFKVNTGYFSFGETTLDIDNLPVKGVTVNMPKLPKTYNEYGYDGKETSVKITEITYKVSGDDLYLYFTGEKMYDEEGKKYSRSCYVGYKLKDSEGYVVSSGSFRTPSLATGEKFKNESEVLYNCIEPGETYTLELSDVD